MITVTVKGIEGVKRNIEVIKNRVVTTAQQGINTFADSVLTYSRELVPKDTTNLMNSSFVAAPDYVDKFSTSNYVFSDQNKDAAILNTNYNISYDTNFRAVSRRKYMTKNVMPNARVVYSAYYALEQHETPLNHKYGQWKFLQTALQGLSYSAVDAVGKRIGAIL